LQPSLDGSRELLVETETRLGVILKPRPRAMPPGVPLAGRAMLASQSSLGPLAASAFEDPVYGAFATSLLEGPVDVRHIVQMRRLHGIALRAHEHSLEGDGRRRFGQ
jgi:hypothetical protein